MTTVVNLTLDELTRTMEELEKLTQQPVMSSRDEKRHAFLLAKVAVLRNSAKNVSVSELKNYERDTLLKAAGLNREPERPKTRLDQEIEQSYRDWLMGHEVRTANIPKDTEVRANQEGVGSITYTQKQAGGAFVAQGFWDRYQMAAKQHDQVFEDWASTPLQTETGSACPLPVVDDTSNSSTIIGEALSSVEADVANFGQKILNAYTFRSGYVAVSIELAQDSAFPLGAVLEKIFSLRHARGVGQYLINGNGVNQPTGLLTAILGAAVTPIVGAGSGNNDGISSAPTSIGSQDLTNVFFGVNAAYRRNAIWYMADTTLSTIMGVVDKAGHPLVQITWGYDIFGQPQQNYYISGRRVAICPSMPSIGSAKNTVIFGNPDFFVVRSVPSSLYFRTFKEAGGQPSTRDFVLSGLIGVESFVRYDSNALIPNSLLSPFAVLQQHS